MPMRRVAEDVFQIPLAPRNAINAYLLGDVVVDAGTKGAAKRLIKALHGHAVGAHALTHGHPDHAGGSKRLADAFEIGVWAGERDRADVQSGRPTAADTWAKPAVARLTHYEPVAVARVLREGDDLGHGPPLRDPAALTAFVAALEA